MEIEWKREFKSNRRWRLNKRKNDAHKQVVSEIPRFENRMNKSRALKKDEGIASSNTIMKSCHDCSLYNE